MIKTRADLFEAAAKMMRMCDEAGVTHVCKYDGMICKDAFFNDVANLAKYEFPLAIVEGKPVFAGDELYRIGGGKMIVEKSDSHNLYGSYDGVGLCYATGFLSWNPPKSKTVMVELLREDAETLQNWLLSPPISDKIANACRKALVSDKK